jgi:hypothetical protein
VACIGDADAICGEIWATVVHGEDQIRQRAAVEEG